jgi:homoserine kinase
VSEITLTPEQAGEMLHGRRLEVIIPATSANLGAGYDCLAMALDLVNRIEVAVEIGDEPLIELQVEGEGAGDLASGRPNAFTNGLTGALQVAFGSVPAGLQLRISMTNRIPLSRGLGSSATAVVGGVLAGNALAGNALDTRTMLAVATRIEGHADNSAAALLGGFVVVDGSDLLPDAIRFDPPAGLKVVLFIPELRLATRTMRAALPPQVPLTDAVINLGRVALGVAGIAKGRMDLLSILTQDRIHEQYRAVVYPQLPFLIDAALKGGAIGACLSGAGSTIIAFCDSDATVEGVRAAFLHASKEFVLPGRVETVAPRATGASVTVLA